MKKVKLRFCFNGFVSFSISVIIKLMFDYKIELFLVEKWEIVSIFKFLDWKCVLSYLFRNDFIYFHI